MSAEQHYPPEAYGLFVAFGINVVLFTIYAGLCARYAFKACPWHDLRASAGAVVAEWSHQVRRCCCATQGASDNELEAFERKVHRLAEQQRLDRGKKLFAFLLPILGGCSVVLIVRGVNLLYWHLHIFRDVSWVQELFHLGAPLKLMMVFAVALYFRLFESSVTAKTLDICHCTLVGRMIWEILASADAHQLLGLHVTLAITFRLVLAVVVGAPTLTFVLNGVHVLATCCRYVALLADMAPEGAEKTILTYGGVYSVLTEQLVSLMVIWKVNTLVQTWTLSMERSKLQVRAATSEQATVKSLLAVLCDAMVSLTGSLMLAAPSPQLGHFLMRHPPDDSYQGAALLDFVEEGDRDRVKQQILSTSRGPGTTLSISTKFINGNGATMDVQMYCVSFTDSDDRQAYCIGMLEVNRSSADAPSFQGSHDGLSVVFEPGALHSVSDPGELPVDSESVVSAVVPLVLNAGGELEACVDIRNSSLPVLSTSASMTQLVGPLEAGGCSLLSWLGEDEAAVAAVVHRIADAIDRYSETREDPLAVADLGRVRLQPRHALRAGLQYIAKVTIDLTSAIDGFNNSNSEQVPVLLRFSEIGMQTASRRARKYSMRPPGCALPPRRQARAQVGAAEGSGAAQVSL
eukprot:TRINITY_DN39039_c0_g1_i7.p1 TRINITY_DN39039_c0_g1~~TRINITY_DN39039_c0_g1_i7.p1  ORF type:complete len:632 (-),score=79.46 TRINITY_DN39039_c0_g1_i7:312-2207(-)